MIAGEGWVSGGCGMNRSGEARQSDLPARLQAASDWRIVDVR